MQASCSIDASVGDVLFRILEKAQDASIAAIATRVGLFNLQLFIYHISYVAMQLRGTMEVPVISMLQIDTVPTCSRKSNFKSQF
jgi:hypothetical protein